MEICSTGVVDHGTLFVRCMKKGLTMEDDLAA